MSQMALLILCWYSFRMLLFHERITSHYLAVSSYRLDAAVRSNNHGGSKASPFCPVVFFWPSLQSPLYFVQAHRLDEDGDTVSWLITGRGKSPQWKW